MIVAIEAAGYGVAGDVNVGPAVVVEVGRTDAKTVRADGRPLIVDERRLDSAARNRDAGAVGNIFKRAVAAIAVQDVGAARESLRAAASGETEIAAVLVGAWLRRPGRIEGHVVGYEKVEVAVAVVVQEGATGVPTGVGPVCRRPAFSVTSLKVPSPLL